MNSTKKESIAITGLINEINKFDNLQEYLKKRDKEPVWDGRIELYKSDSNKASEIIGEIPVQVKGRDAQISRSKDEQVYYDVKITDIENYRKSNIGAIFFVVEIDKSRNTQIFYKEFDLKTIEKILEENQNKNTKTKRCCFTPLKNNNLVSICIEFINKLKIYKEIKPLKEIEVYDKKTICYNYNTKYELSEIKKSNQVFYPTNAYKEAKEKLEKQNIIILHGEPWVGKTSTARKLVSEYIEKEYIFIYGNVDDLPKIKEQVAIDEPIICLLDDFLGSNVTYLEKNVAESTLDQIVKIFKNSDNKKLIFTTRTYIYNNAKDLFYKFYRSTSIKNEYLIDVANYTYEEKGNILYSHMKENGLIGTNTHKQLVKDEFYVDIITHNNFNPGVIALICERLKNKNEKDVKEYIRNALNDPDGLWEEEYKKLSSYEKMILTIIVLFGVKVPEKCVKEQFDEIIKNEDIVILDSETFAKAIDVLSGSFVKATFNDEGDKELEVCKHSIADYIINKIEHKEINLDRYINSAKYVETLYYINLINKDECISEMLAQKAEDDMYSLKSFWYRGKSIIFDLIKKRLNQKRRKILENIIEEEFICGKSNIIIEIVERKYDALYGYTINKFIEFVIEENDLEILYDLSDTLELEVFFSTCSEIFNYCKNTEYMIENLNIVVDVLIEVLSNEVESEMNEIMLTAVAEEIVKDRKSLKEITNEYIYAMLMDEIPSLSNLYSQKYLDKILKRLYKYCYIKIDEEALQKEIEKIKNEEEEEFLDYRYNMIDKEQIKSIKEKFEKGVEKQNLSKTEEELYEELRKSNIRTGNWWTDSFLNNHTYNEYNNLKLYQEFCDKKTDIDKSAKELAKEFLEYILNEKYKISEEAYKLLIQMTYDSFIKGEFGISEEKINLYKKQYSKELKELYKTKIILKINNKTRLINNYIHLFIAINESIKRKDNLFQIFLEWKRDETEKDIEDEIQHILYLYSEINRKEFNCCYLRFSLQYFINEINRTNNMGKIKTSKAIIDFIEPTLYLDKTFAYIECIKRMDIIMQIIKFVRGKDMDYDLAGFDYGIYQKELYDNCYSEEYGLYEIEFGKIIKDTELKNIFDKLKVWDYLYNMYLDTEKALKILEEDEKIDMYQIIQKTKEENLCVQQ